MTDSTQPKTSMRDVVYKCVVDLCEHNQCASRARIVALTGYKMSSVDGCVDSLREDGLIRTVFPGAYEPVDLTEDRPISSTVMSRGRVKLEVGDVVLDLTPRESLALAKLFAGTLLAFSRPM